MQQPEEDHDHLEEHHEADHDHDEHRDEVETHHDATDYMTWLYASLAVLVISLCGIFGVIIIPAMQKIFYQHLLQFLIALGIKQAVKLQLKFSSRST